MPFRKTNLHSKSLTADEILARMEHFCAYRERCPKEVRQKLKDLGASGDTFRQIWEVLQTDRFFDEERFALAFASGKFRFNQWGRLRIRRELLFRQINPELVETALQNIGEEAYLETLEKLFEKKAREFAGDIKAREKTAAYLIRAGFEPDLVFRKLGETRGFDPYSAS